MPQERTHPRARRRMVDTVIFDLDGTLADTLPSIECALNTALRGRGLPPLSSEVIRARVGEGGRALAETAAASTGCGSTYVSAEAVHRDYLREYMAGRHRGTRLYPGARELLDLLTVAEVRLALCTNKPTALVETCLPALGLAHRFGAVVCGDSHRYRKPDPRAVLTAVREAGGEPERALLVGDTEHDVRAARAAGVAIACVSFGYSAVPVCELAPDLVIDGFDVFADLVQRHRSALLPAATPLQP